MAAEAKSKSRCLYKIVLYLIKVTPMIISFGYLLNTVLSYFCIDLPIISYFVGVSLITIVFLYLTSIAFRFCSYHRMFIHYITLNWIFDSIDYNIGIPLSNRDLLLLYFIITGIFLFIILYLYRHDRLNKKTICKDTERLCR